MWPGRTARTVGRAQRDRGAQGGGLLARARGHPAREPFCRRGLKLCASHYKDAARGGRPGIDPVIYFKMLMVGFFEDLPSQRAIAARCDDSRALREFLGYDLSEATPEQSSFTVIRQRLPLETIEAGHGVVFLCAARARAFARAQAGHRQQRP